MKRLLPLLFLLISFNVFAQDNDELLSPKANKVSFKVYPNPSKVEDKLALKFDKKVSVKSVEIFDLFGKSIKRFKPDLTPTTNFAVGTLPRGIFLLRIRTEKAVTTRRIIVR